VSKFSRDLLGAVHTGKLKDYDGKPISISATLENADSHPFALGPLKEYQIEMRLGARAFAIDEKDLEAKKDYIWKDIMHMLYDDFREDLYELCKVVCEEVHNYEVRKKLYKKLDEIQYKIFN
jgi:hypothetical protein